MIQEISYLDFPSIMTSVGGSDQLRKVLGIAGLNMNI